MSRSIGYSNKWLNEGVAASDPCSWQTPTEPNFEALRLAAQVRRQVLGLSLKQLVRRTGVAESTLTGALYGYHEGSVRTWWEIAHALEMSIGDLLNHLADSDTKVTVPSTTVILPLTSSRNDTTTRSELLNRYAT